MRQRQTLTRGAGREQELPCAAGESERHGAHVGRDESHHIADREHGGHGTAGGVNPQGDIVIGIGGEREQLRDEDGAVVIVECAVEHQHPLAVQVFA